LFQEQSGRLEEQRALLPLLLDFEKDKLREKITNLEKKLQL
jgi:hypothetical protein